jgi:Ca2+-binding RTX toxin-like protein
MKKLLVALAVSLVVLPGIAFADKGAGPDTLTGTSGDDLLEGGRSPDVIYGLKGDDSIWGQRAPDLMYGGAGDDDLHGFGSGETHDLLDGGSGWDKCVGTDNDTFVRCEVVKIRKGLGPRG